MSLIKRSAVYFEKPGILNTKSVIEAVGDRLEQGDIGIVLVPVTTGKTAEQFKHALNKDIKIATVSEKDTLLACKHIEQSTEGLLGRLLHNHLKKDSERAEKKREREIFDMTFLPFCSEKWNAVKETLYAFGQGMKVAIEVSIAAVETLKVQPYTKIIAVGGTGEGVDTAIVITTSTQKEAFGKNPNSRLIIHEIIAMPIEKW
jgi:hypothetical protein